MTVVVTGAAGFIGAHLVAALTARGYTVAGIDRRPGVPAVAHARVTVDLLDGGVVEDVLRGAEAVFHLAAFAGVRAHGPEAQRRWMLDNVEATRRVVELVPRDVPLVVTSSSSVYGGSSGSPCVESDPLRPRGGYARSKVAVERLCHDRALNGGAVAIARPFTVAGEGQRPDMAISRWIAAARLGRPLRVFGGLDRTRDVTDVRDVVAALIRMLERGLQATVNVGTGRAHRLRDIIAAVAAATGATPAIALTPAAPQEVPATLADTTRCDRLLGFVPGIELHDIVRRQAAAAEPDVLLEAM